MRTYYLFKIKDSINKTQVNEFNIYKTLDNIYSKRINEIESKKIILKTLDFINQNDYSLRFERLYKEDDFYSNRNKTHSYFDYFNNEETKMYISNTFIKITSNKNIPTFLYDLLSIDNFFICDFFNVDYFWLSEINRKSLVN